MFSSQPHAHKEQRTAYSSGGVIYRYHQQHLEVALIATHAGQRWGLPKGHVRRGETAEAAALREIAEETGLNGAIECHLATIEYWFRIDQIRIHKYVDLFLVRYLSGVLVPQPTEIDDVGWFPIEQALSLASFDRERDVLDQVWRLALNGGLKEEPGT